MPIKNNHKNKDMPWDPWDGEYIGNIWGWKFSFISLGIILFFLFIAIYRFIALDKSPDLRKDQTEMTVDSTRINSK